jgi:hypothetical protein
VSGDQQVFSSSMAHPEYLAAIRDFLARAKTGQIILHVKQGIVQHVEMLDVLRVKVDRCG